MVSQVISAVVGSNAANKSAKIQDKAAHEAADTQWRMYNQQREDTMPWLNAGTAGVNRLSELLGIGGNTGASDYGALTKSFGMEDFQKDPGYDFNLAEGEKALNRSYAAKNGVLSGAAAKGLQRYSQDYASNEFGKAYDRYNANQTNLFNRLSGISGTGQAAANTLGSAGSTAGQVASDYLTSGAAARANAKIDQANAWTSGLNSIQDMFRTAASGGAF